MQKASGKTNGKLTPKARIHSFTTTSNHPSILNSLQALQNTTTPQQSNKTSSHPNASLITTDPVPTSVNNHLPSTSLNLRYIGINSLRVQVLLKSNHTHSEIFRYCTLCGRSPVGGLYEVCVTLLCAGDASSIDISEGERVVERIQRRRVGMCGNRGLKHLLAIGECSTSRSGVLAQLLPAIR